jgi:hypothetical protein
MLNENYNSEELVTKLVSLGDASSIQEKLNPVGPHSFDKPEDDVCIFYGRDRGEQDVGPTCYTKKLLLDSYYYAYVWENGCWNFYKGGKEIC